MPIRVAAALGLVSVAGCLLLVGLLHVLGGLDPLWMTLSEYALGPLGWMFDLGVTGLAAGSLLVLFALLGAVYCAGRRRARSRCWSGPARCWCWCCSRRRTGRSGRA